MAAEVNINLTFWDLIKGVLGADAQKDTRTPLDKAIDLPEDSPAALEKKLKRIDKLIAAGADVNDHRNDHGAWTPLMRASGKSGVAVVRRLIDAGADLNPRYLGKMTPLMCASGNADPAVMRLLLDAGADSNARIRIFYPHNNGEKEADGDSVLMVAAAAGNLAMVTLLLDRGAEVNYQHRLRHSGSGPSGPALNRAIFMHHHFSTPLQDEAEKSALRARYRGIVRLLLERGADANLADSLTLALKEDGAVFVPMLLKHGARINSPQDSPLVLAAYHAYPEALQLLLAHGADIRAVDRQGRNALVAALHGLAHSKEKLGLVEQLFAAGVPLNAKDGGLSTTLNHAIMGAATATSAYSGTHDQENETKLLLRLIELGADLDGIGTRQTTSLELARNSRITPVVEAIERRLSAVEIRRIEAAFQPRPTLAARVAASASSRELPALIPSRRLSVPEAVHALAVSLDGRFVASGGPEGALRLWEVAGGRVMHELKGHTDTIASLAFTHDGKHLLSGSRDTSVRLWDIASGKEVRRFSGHAGPVHVVGFFSDSKSFFSASQDTTLRRWDTASGHTVMIYSGGGTASADVSPDGRTLISQDGSYVYEWNAASGKIQRIHNVMGGYHFSRFSPDGRSILSDVTGPGGGMALFDASSGQEHFRVMPHHVRLQCAAFSPDGRRLVSTSDNGELLLTDAVTGKPLAWLQAHRQNVLAAAFLPGGRTLVSGGDDKTLMFWTLPRADQETARPSHSGKK